MEPALAAFLLRARIPGDRQGLQPAAAELHKILLERLDSESEFHFVFVQRAVGSVGADHEGVAAAVESAGHTGKSNARVMKIARHGRLRRVLHGARVMGAFPGVGLRLMALAAGLAADIICDCGDLRRLGSR